MGRCGGTLMFSSRSSLHQDSGLREKKTNFMFKINKLIDYYYFLSSEGELFIFQHYSG